MRLIVALDEYIDNSRLKSNDIVLVNSFELFNSIKRDYQVYLVDFSLCDEEEMLPSAINSFFEQLPDEFKTLRNVYFSMFFRPLCSLIKQVETIVNEYAINEIILFGGSNFNFITLFGGEGEAVKHLYKSSWLFNQFLFQYFEGKVEVKWKKRKANLSYLHIYREYLRFLKLIIKAFYLSITGFNNKAKWKLKAAINNKNIFVFASNMLHLNQLKKILTDISNYQIHYLTHYNSRLLKANKNINIIKYAPISIASLITSFLKFNRLSKLSPSKDLTLAIYGQQLEVNTKCFLRSMMVNYINTNAHLIELQVLFRDSQRYLNSYLVTGYTFGEDIVLTHELAKKLSLKHYNFQTVTMAKMLLPQFDLADRYFMYAHRTFEMYKQYDPSYEYYLPLSGKDKVENRPIRVKKSVCLSIFTQPDNYTERYLKLLNDLLPIINKKLDHCTVLIKPHYRQDKISMFEKLAKKYDFVELLDKSDSPQSIMEKSHFSLSMTSSVLFEAVLLGCPALIADFDGIDTKCIYGDDVSFPEVNHIVNSSDDVIKVLKEKDFYIKLYFSKRNAWIMKNKVFRIQDVFIINDAG